MESKIKIFANIIIISIFFIVGFLIYSLIHSFAVMDFLKHSVLSGVLKTLFTGYIISIAFFIVLDNKSPNKIISWLILLYAFPFVGFLAYLTFGRSFRKERIVKAKKAYMYDTINQRAPLQLGFVKSSPPFKDNVVNKKLVSLLINNANAPFYTDNTIKIYSDGHDFFNDLIQDIQSAKYHIHLEYFIIRNDKTGNILKEHLIKKAKDGVEVRLIYDSVGCWRLGDDYLQALTDAGVQCHPFLPIIIPILGRELNYRNHRKITIIDGEIGYIGGMNIGDEYLGLNPDLGYWRDTHTRIIGESVQSIQNYFMVDWAFVSNQELDSSVYIKDTPVAGRSVTQIVASGPDTDWEVMLQAYFTIITNACERIWITTPYLVPEESILEALKTAALSGVDVRILIPSKPDHFLVYWATRANLKPILRAGVKVYLYQNGFVHSKTIIADDTVASVGSANLDIRSLEINFEINAFLYDTFLIQRLADDFKKDLLQSKALTYETFMQRPWYHKVFEGIGRLVSPLQ